MKSIGDVMQARSPSEVEAEILAHVVELAQSWESGGLPLAELRRQCSGYERWQAMRFAPLGSAEKMTLMALADALVAEDASGFVSEHGWIDKGEEIFGFSPQVKVTTNHEGKRVLVWPMFSIEGEPVYPLVDQPLDTKRIERQHAATMAYNEHRRKKRGGG